MSDSSVDLTPPAPGDPPASAPAATDEHAIGAPPDLGATLDIGSQTEDAPDVVRSPATLRGRVLEDGTSVATGRRKTAVARVRVKKGTGVFTVNSRPMEEFFRIERDQLIVQRPLQIAGMGGQVDVWVRANGGGISGQAGAIVLGLARALQALHPELHGKLSEGGLLTRDDRMVERKKYGHKKARRSFQFSKR